MFLEWLFENLKSRWFLVTLFCMYFIHSLCIKPVTGTCLTIIWVVPCQKYLQGLSSELFFPLFYKCLQCMLLWFIICGSPFTFRVIGNPLICGPKAGNNCSAVFPEPLSLPPDGLKGDDHCVTDTIFWHYSSALQFDYMFEYIDLWFLRSIRLWIKRPSHSCCFWC